MVARKDRVGSYARIVPAARQRWPIPTNTTHDKTALRIA